MGNTLCSVEHYVKILREYFEKQCCQKQKNVCFGYSLETIMIVFLVRNLQYFIST